MKINEDHEGSSILNYASAKQSNLLMRQRAQFQISNPKASCLQMAACGLKILGLPYAESAVQGLSSSPTSLEWFERDKHDVYDEIILNSSSKKRSAA